MAYDKAKNGWNRDWETDNIPDDMSGETPSALSAAPRADVIRLVAMLTFSNYTSAADYEAKLRQGIERVTPYFETYAADLREKLSTAEAELARVREVINKGKIRYSRDHGMPNPSKPFPMEVVFSMKDWAALRTGGEPK